MKGATPGTSSGCCNPESIPPPPTALCAVDKAVAKAPPIGTQYYCRHALPDFCQPAQALHVQEDTTTGTLSESTGLHKNVEHLLLVSM